MKTLLLICFLLISILFVNANYGCNNKPCGPGRLSLTLRGTCSCVDILKCREVALSSKFIGNWVTDNKQFSQYNVDIINYLDFDIKSIFIGTDETFRIHGDNIWNIKRCNNGMELTLPDYQKSINSKESYTFGFILYNTTSIPNLSILAVTYE